VGCLRPAASAIVRSIYRGVLVSNILASSITFMVQKVRSCPPPNLPNPLVLIAQSNSKTVSFPSNVEVQKVRILEDPIVTAAGSHYKLAFPLVSKGRSKAIIPAAKNSAPETGIWSV
jgi:hypothetical protein